MGQIVFSFIESLKGKHFPHFISNFLVVLSLHHMFLCSQNHLQVFLASGVFKPLFPYLQCNLVDFACVYLVCVNVFTLPEPICWFTLCFFIQGIYCGVLLPTQRSAWPQVRKYMLFLFSSSYRNYLHNRLNIGSDLFCFAKQKTQVITCLLHRMCACV